MKTYAFIDASNIIYGTRDEGWKVDFKKLHKYLRERYECKRIYYFAGKYRESSKQEKFYTKLKSFDYILVLKTVKIYLQPDGKKIRKANCDVDLTFIAMRDKDLYKRGIFMTGDGDFSILLEYLIKKEKKEIIVIANGDRTAKEIRQITREKFTELKSLKRIIEYKKKVDSTDESTSRFMRP